MWLLTDLARQHNFQNTDGEPATNGDLLAKEMVQVRRC